MNEIIFRFLYGLAAANVWFKVFTIFAGVYLGWSLLVLVILIFAGRSRDQTAAGRELFFVVSAAAGAWLTSFLIKWLWPVARPFVVLQDVVPLIKVSDAGAFPSGHATFFFALAIAAYSVDRRLGRWLIAAAAVIGLARVAAGVHWPFDILGGMTVAIFIVPLVLFFIRLFKPGFGRAPLD